MLHHQPVVAASTSTASIAPAPSATFAPLLPIFGPGRLRELAEEGAVSRACRSPPVCVIACACVHGLHSELRPCTEQRRGRTSGPQVRSRPYLLSASARRIIDLAVDLNCRRICDVYWFTVTPIDDIVEGLAWLPDAVWYSCYSSLLGAFSGVAVLRPVVGCWDMFANFTRCFKMEMFPQRERVLDIQCSLLRIFNITKV